MSAEQDIVLPTDDGDTAETGDVTVEIPTGVLESKVPDTSDVTGELESKAPDTSDDDFDEILIPMPTETAADAIQIADLLRPAVGAGVTVDGRPPPPQPELAAPPPTTSAFPAVMTTKRRGLNVEVLMATALTQEQLTAAPTDSANPPDVRIIVGIDGTEAAQLIAINAIGNGWTGHMTHHITPTTYGSRAIILARGTKWCLKGTAVMYHNNNTSVLSAVLCINLQGLDGGIVSMSRDGEATIYIPFTFCENDMAINAELGNIVGDLCNVKIQKRVSVMVLSPTLNAIQKHGITSGLSTRCTPLRILTDIRSPDGADGGLGRRGVVSPWTAGLCALEIKQILVTEAGMGLFIALQTV